MLSGPTFAHGVARNMPTAVTLAAQQSQHRRGSLRTDRSSNVLDLRSNDVAGAEIGGAVKNVLAIACGVVEGKALGQNARAALIARGFAEMTRFGLAYGAKRETLSGLSGLGDLVLTCSSTSSGATITRIESAKGVRSKNFSRTARQSLKARLPRRSLRGCHSRRESICRSSTRSMR